MEGISFWMVIPSSSKRFSQLAVLSAASFKSSMRPLEDAQSMHGVILPLTIVRKRVNYFPVSLDHLRLLFNRLRMLPKGQLHSPRAPPGTSQGTQFRSFSSVPRSLRPMFRADFRSVRCFRSLGSLSTLQCAPFCPLSGRQDAEFQPGPLGRRIPSGGGFSPLEFSSQRFLFSSISFSRSDRNLRPNRSPRGGRPVRLCA